MSTFRDTVQAGTISDAWLKAVELVGGLPGRSTFHLVVRIDEPARETNTIRTAADLLLQGLRLPRITTVRNTIFPNEVAKRFPEPADLSAYYRHRYPSICRFNRRGTYFGRLVSLPDGDGPPIDQLSNVVDKLRRRSRRRMTSRYELNMYLAAVDRNVALGFRA